jgi:hypothetical protein
MRVLFPMGMEVFVNCFSVDMHVFVDEVYSEKEGHIVEHIRSLIINLDAMIFAHNRSSVADLLNYLQVMSGSDHRLSRSAQFLQELDQP